MCVRVIVRAHERARACCLSDVTATDALIQWVARQCRALERLASENQILQNIIKLGSYIKR